MVYFLDTYANGPENVSSSYTNPRANHYIKRKLLEDDNDFAQLLSSTGIHKTTRKPSICASFAENKNKCILVFDNICEVKLNEVERLPWCIRIMSLDSQVRNRE
jgi:hypothetical protein